MIDRNDAAISLQTKLIRYTDRSDVTSKSYSCAAHDSKIMQESKAFFRRIIMAGNGETCGHLSHRQVVKVRA